MAAPKKKKSFSKKRIHKYQTKRNFKSFDTYKKCLTCNNILLPHQYCKNCFKTNILE